MTLEAKYLGDGSRIEYTPGSAVSAGDVIEVGKFCGVATNDIGAGVKDSLAVYGVFDLPREGSTAFLIGADVYWDADATSEAGDATGACVSTSAAGANNYIGKSIAAAADSASVLNVRVALTNGYSRDTIAFGDISDVDVGTPTDKNVIVANGTKWNSVAMSGLTRISNAGAVSLGNIADAGWGLPIYIQKTFGDDATGDVVVLNANCPQKLRIVDVWVENRAANGVNANTIQLCAAAAGASPITDAIALSGIADTVTVEAATIDDATGTLAAGASLYIRQTKAGGTMGGNVYVVAIPVA